MSPSSDFLLGIDLGTSGCKVIALSSDGTTLGAAESRYPMISERAGWAEQDPALWWAAVRSALTRLLEQLPPRSRPLGIGVTGQMHSLVVLDKALDVIRPSILWADQRSESEAAQIADIVGAAELQRITRNPSRAAFTASKILWLRRNEPTTTDRLRHVLMPKDWLVLRLTGELAAEPSDASGTGLFDVANSSWSPEIMSALSLPAGLFPCIRLSDDIVGTLTVDAAAYLGLDAGIPVIAGSGDQAAAAYDAGATSAGIVACNLGTSIALTESVAEPVDGTLSHVVPDQWLFLTSAHSGTVALDWWGRIAGRGHAGGVVEDAAKSAPGARGARFVPLLLGSRDAGSKNPSGSFLGLREDHTGADLARAVLEGIALEVRHIAEMLPSIDGAEQNWRVFGGGARGELLLQVLADVLQKPLQVIPEASSARGAARLLGHGIGVEAPLIATARARVRPEEGSRYQSAYDDYLSEIA